jgi:hypothetical protein
MACAMAMRCPLLIVIDKTVGHGVQYFRIIGQNCSYNYYFSKNYVKYFADYIFFCPTNVSLKLLKLPDRQNCNITTLGGGGTPPRSYSPGHKLLLVLLRCRKLLFIVLSNEMPKISVLTHIVSTGITTLYIQESVVHAQQLDSSCSSVG